VRRSEPSKLLPELVSGRGTARRSRGVEGCARAGALSNEEQNTVQILENIDCANAQCLDPTLPEPGITPGIPRRSIAPGMRLSIDLDAQLRPVTIEIERVFSGGVLLAPLEASLRSPKLLPQQHFGQRHLPPQCARAPKRFPRTPDHPLAPRRRANPSTMLRMVPLPETSSGRI
jgi:hypothetical protein